MIETNHYPVSSQMFRFVLVGGMNTLFAYGVYALAIYAGLHYTLAVLAGGVAPMLTGYEAHRRFVFRCARKNRLPRYAGVFVGVYLANIGLLKLLLEYGRLGGAYASGAIAIFICACLSFALNKFIVFRD